MCKPKKWGVVLFLFPLSREHRPLPTRRPSLTKHYPRLPSLTRLGLLAAHNRHLYKCLDSTFGAAAAPGFIQQPLLLRLKGFVGRGGGE